jgi:hypothetical protein
MNDDLTLLASAYLDGEATPDERARVEADPLLLGEVERLRTARVRLLDTTWFERPSDEVREAAIAAALGAWDVTASGSSVAGAETPPAGRQSNVRTFERRRTYTRWLGAAAALVAIAALGVVVSQIGGRSDDAETSSVAVEAPADTTAAAGALFDSADEQPEQSAAGGDAGRAATADDSGGAGPASEAAELAPSAPAGTPAPAATEPAAVAGDLASAPAALAVMQTPRDLAAVAADANAAVENGTNHDVVARPCSDDAFDDIDTYVAFGTYRDVSVVIGIDDDADRAIAIDPDTCEIVAEAPLP